MESEQRWDRKVVLPPQESRLTFEPNFCFLFGPGADSSKSEENGI
jgi:hypothetical protein